MLLIIKIEDLKYSNDINECLLHNISNPYITKIIIFSSINNIEKEIVVDQKSKKVLLLKSALDIFDMIKYAKRSTKRYVIYSTPFIKFNNDLSSIMNNFDKNKIAMEENSYYIFEKSLNIIKAKLIDDILFGEKIKLNLRVQKLGYHSSPDLEYLSRSWNISKKIDVVQSIKTIEKKVEVPVKKVHIVEEIITTDLSIDDISKSIDNRVRKIDVVIVSVNYNDFLLISLENNSKIFDNITVVTSSSDFMCQKICEKFGVKCLITDIMYEDGDFFNKGKAINEGIKSISNPDYILLLDADILVMEQIDVDSLEENVLYTSDRYIVPNYNSYQRYISGDITKDNLFIEGDQGLGFFQLFNFCMRNKYPQYSADASNDDLNFRDSFNLRKSIEKFVIHLGTDSNWQGRKSEAFLKSNIFLELLSENKSSIEKKNAIDLTDAYRKSVIINKSNLPVENDFEYFETCNKSGKSTGRKILFLIYLNNIGGAEYVSYQHIKMCKELGYSPVVLSAEKGMFFDKIKELDVDLYYSKLYEMDKDSIMNVLFDLSNDCDIIYNCNYFGITPFIKELRTIRDFKYYTIAHSDIEWVVNSLFEYDSITDKYIVIHDKIRTELNKFGVCNTRITTIPNYVDFNKIRKDFEVYNNKSLKNKLGIKKGDFVVGMITRISADKNILDTLSVINSCNIKNIKLLIVGDSPKTNESLAYKEELMKEIERMMLEDKVIITGQVDNEDMYKYISCFSISINTSPSEGLPISLLEQMACGIHCVYPSHGEIPSVLEGYGTVVKINQKKSFDKSNRNNYIYSRYTKKELYPFVREIERINKEGSMDCSEISNHIKYSRSVESFRYYMNSLYGDYLPGVSFLIRARNEEHNVRICIESIVDIADEIVFVDHLSTDNTYSIAVELSRKYRNVKVFKYEMEVAKPGDKYQNNIDLVGNGIANYYNFCLTKVTRRNLVKWDADFIPNRQNLIEMIDEYNLRYRMDRFSLWFTGKTLFLHGNQSYINDDSYYDENRVFSMSNGVKWKDAIRCEYIDPEYIEESIKLRYELPCFFEIKRTDIDEFELRDGLIDKRDKADFDILEGIRSGKLPKELKKIKNII